MLEFVRVVKAREQVVSGRMHYLVVEAIDAGKKKLYEAKIWVKPWLNFKQVQEFKASDVGVKQEWRDVQPHDPQVEYAANHAIKTLQQRSNSLFPYQLQQILHAKAQVIEEHARFNMLLKLKRGDKEVKYRVEVHKNNEGVYNLIQMEVEN